MLDGQLQKHSKGKLVMLATISSVSRTTLQVQTCQTSSWGRSLALLAARTRQSGHQIHASIRSRFSLWRTTGYKNPPRLEHLEDQKKGIQRNEHVRSRRSHWLLGEE